VRVAYVPTGIGAQARLSATIQRRDAVPFAGESKPVGPFAAMPGVAVELKDSGSIFRPFRSDVLCVNVGSMSALEPEAKTLVRTDSKINSLQPDLGIDAIEFGE